MPDRPLLLAVMGPTGAGKTFVAELLADALDAQLINADAFQVYRGLDIGTSKPTDKARYRLLDVKEPTEGFGVGEWIRLAQVELERLWDERRSAIVVGGTGFYVRALFEQYADLQGEPDPELRQELMRAEREQGLEALAERLRRLDPGAAEATDLKNPVRVRRALERLLSPAEPVKVSLPPFARHKVALIPPSEKLDPVLKNRVLAMLRAGWAAEVEALLEKGVTLDAPSMRAIGYQCVADFLNRQISQEEMVDRVWQATRRYAKRQRTWLRSEPDLREITSYGIDEGGLRDVVGQCLRLFT